MKSAQEIAADLVMGLEDKTLEPDTSQPSIESMETIQKHERLMEWFWGKMMVAYGTQWESSYGHVDGAAFEAWSKALRNVRPDSFKYGLNQLLTDQTMNPNFPPNLIKFLRLCRAAPVINSQMYEDLRLPPPIDRSDPSLISAKDKCIQEAQELLGTWDPPKKRER
jgi:hypothetical protein